MERKRILSVSSAILLCAITLGIFGIASALQSGKVVPNSGSVKGIKVGIYWNSECTNQTSSINWGMLNPGSNKTVTVYARNEGNTIITLSKTVQSWNPSNASSYMTLNWNYTSQTLSINQVLTIDLTLSVSSTISGITNFSFSLTIIGNG
jgi:hypothetical protein